MKKIKQIILVAALFLIFNSTVFADTFKCNDCNGPYNVSNVTCKYEVSNYYTYDNSTGTFIIDGNVEEDSDSFYVKLKVHFDWSKKEVTATTCDPLRSRDCSEYTESVSINSSDFYDATTDSFYCPKHIYADREEVAYYISRVSTSNEKYGSYIYKNEYSLVNEYVNEAYQPKCLNCNGKEIWNTSKFLTGFYEKCIEVPGKTELTCGITNAENAKCYDLCKEYSSGICTQYYDLLDIEPDSSYSVKQEVDIQRCGMINKDELENCETYNLVNYSDLNNPSMNVYKSKYGAYVLSDGKYNYIRDSKPYTCPDDVYKIYEGIPVVYSNTDYRIAGPNYYIAGDSIYLNKECTISGNCAQYTKKIESGETGTDDPNNNSGEKPKNNKCYYVDHSSDVACGALYNIPKQLPQLLTLFMNLIKIFTPIILIIKGLIDLFKAITGNNEQEIVKARSKFFKRLIPAVMVFLVILIAQFLFGLVGTDGEANTFLACSNCFLNNNCEKNYYLSNEDCDGSNKGSGLSGSGSSDWKYDSSTSSKLETTRKSIVNVARNAYNNTSSWIYLLPNSEERNSSQITRISNLKYGYVTGGDCLSKTYNNQKCLEIDGNKYYGTDCNGFVGYIYHSIGLNGVDYRFFGHPETYNNSTDDRWNTLPGMNKYFDTFYFNDLNSLESKAEKGDAVARRCKGDHSHIAIYVGDGMVIDNAGWTKDDSSRRNPIKNRTLEQFSGGYSNCTYTLFKLK